MQRVAACLLGLCVAYGCGNSFDPASYVVGLRVLAVRAEPPEVAPGQSTTLSALAVNTDGAPVEIEWSACTLPSLPGSSSLSSKCFQNDTAPYLVALGSGQSVTATVPKLDLSSFGLPDASGGVYLPIRARARSDGDQLDAAYHLRLSQSKTPNHNPTLQEIDVVSSSGSVRPLLEAAPLTVHVGDEVILRATASKDSAETYQLPAAEKNVQVTEIVRFSWFATGGSFSHPVTGEAKPDTAFRANGHLPKSGAKIDLYIVARDERGGTDYTHRVLQLR